MTEPRAPFFIVLLYSRGEFKARRSVYKIRVNDDLFVSILTQFLVDIYLQPFYNINIETYEQLFIYKSKITAIGAWVLSGTALKVGFEEKSYGTGVVITKFNMCSLRSEN